MNKPRTNTEVFRALRAARSLSLKELGRRVGLDATQVSRIESGRCLPRVDRAIRIAKELRSSVERLWPEAA